MAKGFCPYCDTLQGISPTGDKKHVGWSAEWWRVDMHRKPDDRPDVVGEVCEGSGRLL